MAAGHNGARVTRECHARKENTVCYICHEEDTWQDRNKKGTSQEGSERGACQGGEENIR